MNSAEIKAAFAAAGIKVRVRADAWVGAQAFRVCRLNEVPHDEAVSKRIAAELGLTDILRVPGADVCGYELQAYKFK